jgi:predicted dienelactone hydrolase
VHDNIKDVSFPVLTLYPTLAPSQSVAFGPYTLDVAPEAPLDGKMHPLIVISHGGGSSHLLLRTMALYLAKNGYVVALPEHYGNNRVNNSLDNTIENLEIRPRHVRLTIDAMVTTPPFAESVQKDNVGLIGHSLGGYTALAVGGGQPCYGIGQNVTVTSDHRIKALALLAPATSFYVPNEALANVKVPILLLSAEHDRITPPWQAQLVLDLIPDRSQVTHRMVANANHYSFLSPFPASMKRPGFVPAIDPEGFDREAFHELLNADLLAFMQNALRPA